jgi:hypothetical protein
VIPAHDTITFLRVVLMCSEVARSEFKLDPHPLFAVASVPVGDAIGIGGADLLDSELQPLRDSLEQEHHAQLVLGSILKRRVLERQRALGRPHQGKSISVAGRMGPRRSHYLARQTACRPRGYTKGMKTAISIPDEVFQGAERLARRTRKSRSQVFSDAVREYVARHDPDEVTEAMNRVCDEVGNTSDPFVSAAARRLLEQVEW